MKQCLSVSAPRAHCIVSLHRYPFYPGTGGADETGTGDGLGATLNLPLPGKTRPPAFREAFQQAMDRVTAFDPGLLLASAGFDAYRHDPIGGLNLRLEDYRWIGEQMRAVADATCQGRLVALLEGGYDLQDLGKVAREFAEGMGG